MKEDGLRKELVERIQHIRRLEDGLMQRLSVPDQTRLLQEQKLLEPMLGPSYHEDLAKSGVLGGRDDRLLMSTNQNMSGMQDTKIAEEEISKNQEIVAMWAETGLLLNRIIADKDLEISELHQQAEASVGLARARIHELESTISTLLEEKKAAYRECEESRSIIRELKGNIRDLKFVETKAARDAARLEESEARARELQALVREYQIHGTRHSDPTERAAASNLKEELLVVSEQRDSAEAHARELEQALRESRASGIAAADSAAESAAMVSGLSMREAALLQEAERLRVEQCVSESRLQELETELRGAEARARAAEEEAAGALAAESRARLAERRLSALQVSFFRP